MHYPEVNSTINYERANQRWNGWGAYDQDFHHPENIEELLNLLRKQLKMSALPDTPSVEISELKIKKSSLTGALFQSLRKQISADKIITDDYERILHSAGRSYFDVLRLRLNKLTRFVDAVVYPHNEKDIKLILDWANKNKFTVIPYGGGSSVVGGLETLAGKKSRGMISLDLTAMKSVLHLDRNSYLAEVEAGIYGPQLEEKLQKEGFTLGHFPQSFEYSTLGGWIAARSAGQQSNRYGKIEEMVTQVRVVSPAGIISSYSFPHPALGPDLRQLLIGSEGLLGIISSAILKINKLPMQRLYTAFLLKDFSQGAEVVREIHHLGIGTAMARLSDASETQLFEMLAMAGKKKSFLKDFIKKIILKKKDLWQSRCLLLIGVEGDPASNKAKIKRVMTLVKEKKGLALGPKYGERWLKGRFNLPFLRNYVLDYGIGIDTFETSCDYSKVDEVHEKVYHNLKGLLPNAQIMCHISHNYHQGCCLYFTIIFAMDNDPIKQWQKLKSIASDTLVNCGAAISHHHGIGADHKKWYLKQVDALAIESLRQVKKQLDPQGILNPCKLFD